MDDDDALYREALGQKHWGRSTGAGLASCLTSMRTSRIE
jgi:hypothetical protein